MKKATVSIVMGSDSDFMVMAEARSILEEYDVPCDINILSAHRTPEDVRRFSRAARDRGVRVIIAGAGGAAHLAGVIASSTTLPVIGVPMETKELKGIDSLFSTVQMPAGIPVATVSIGISGAKNAALLALQILGTGDKRIARLLEEGKKRMARAVRAKGRALARRAG